MTSCNTRRVYDAGGRVGFEDKYGCLKKELEVFLDDNLPSFINDGQKLLGDAMRYGVTTGGKRLRGVLALASSDLLCGAKDIALPIAGALEYLHAYSLIHDDMPCMDDDDYRRGKPSCHKVYGEGAAMLAGDALLNLAFEILLDNAVSGPQADGPRRYKFAEAAAYIARAAGSSGMAGGQAIDMFGDIRDESQLAALHGLKTGRLFEAAVLAPAICLGAEAGEYDALKRYGVSIGYAFQIRDDLTDLDNAGSDERKRNFAALFGISYAERALNEHYTTAVDSLAGFTERADFLRDIAGFMAGVI